MEVLSALRISYGDMISRGEVCIKNWMKTLTLVKLMKEEEENFRVLIEHEILSLQKLISLISRKSYLLLRNLWYSMDILSS